MEAALQEEFARSNFIYEDETTAEHCVAMCTSFNMEPADFVSNWEVFYLNRQLTGEKVSNARMPGFRQFLQEQQKEAFRQQQIDIGVHTYTSYDIDMAFDDNDDDAALDQQFTPPRLLSSFSKRIPTTPGSLARKKKILLDNELASVAPTTPAASRSSGSDIGQEGPRPRPINSPETPFNRREQKFTTLSAYNDHLKELEELRDVPNSEDDVLHRLPPIARCDVNVLGTYPNAGCRYMNDRVDSRFIAIEKRVKRFAEAIVRAEGRSVSHNVAVASQEVIIVVGKICCDGEGRLNSKSVLLEGSVEYSGGQRVRLDLSNVEHYSLFPGQIVGVEGYNPSGYCFVASRLICAVPKAEHEAGEEPEPPMKRHGSDNPKKSEEEDSPKPSQKQITVVLAAGPFSANDNLFFEPLAELFAYARRKRPRLLVLMGPFVDSEHSLIKQGLVDKTFEQIFYDEIILRIDHYCTEMGDGARVLLIPSCRDAHHDFVFPQPPFSKDGVQDENQISFLANPCVVKCDEAAFGLCSVDTLRHLSGEELSAAPPGSDRITRLASHIIAQRSFYPLFPTPSGTPLDLSLAGDALSIPEIPNILMVSSDLAPFVKVVSPSLLTGVQQTGNDASTALCINPGRLTKGCSAGTFSEILILPESLPREDVDNNHAVSPSSLNARTRVFIKRI